MTAVRITDVVLRDGLQDEPVITSVADRIAIARALLDAGIRDLEAASFVDPRRVPQMGGAEEVAAGVHALPAPADSDADAPAPAAADGIVWRALALNRRGVERAAAAGFRHVSLVVSASVEHSRANAGRTPREAIEDLGTVVEAFPGVSFTGGVATAFVCPFEGDIPAARTAEIALAYREIGIRRIGFADTIGTASPGLVEATLGAVLEAVGGTEISLHLHNAQGQALATVDRALGLGVTNFDAATGGYGGCPFAPGAHGNIATEELVAHLASRGIETGIDLDALSRARALIVDALARGESVPA